MTLQTDLRFVKYVIKYMNTQCLKISITWLTLNNSNQSLKQATYLTVTSTSSKFSPFLKHPYLEPLEKTSSILKRKVAYYTVTSTSSKFSLFLKHPYMEPLKTTSSNLTRKVAYFSGNLHLLKVLFVSQASSLKTS